MEYCNEQFLNNNNLINFKLIFVKIDQMIAEETVPAMWEDGYESSHPLQLKLETTSQIISVFDTITSGKGAAIMRMVESIVGFANFQASLKVIINLY